MANNTRRQLFTIEIPIKILAASTCMIDFFSENIVASNFWDDRKSTLRWKKDLLENIFKFTRTIFYICCQSKDMGRFLNLRTGNCDLNALSTQNSMDPFMKRHRLVHNGGFTKFEAVHWNLNMVNSIESL